MLETLESFYGGGLAFGGVHEACLYMSSEINRI